MALNESHCQSGLMIPLWLPVDNLGTGDLVTRGLIYFAILSFLFVGLAVVVNRLMTAVEVITSQDVQRTIKVPEKEPKTVRIRFWNKTIAHVSIIAVGSAPEIIYPIIFLFRREFGDMFFFPIAGCAAFRFLFIAAICVYVVPSDQKRKILYYDVYFTVAFWGLIGYAWVSSAIREYSPGVIKWWEALVALLFYLVFILLAFASDQQFSIIDWCIERLFRRKKKAEKTESERAALVETGNPDDEPPGDGCAGTITKTRDQKALAEFKQTQKTYINILYQLRCHHPTADLDALEYLAREDIIDWLPKSRAYYWIQATRRFTGGIVANQKAKTSDVLAKLTEEKNKHMRIYFEHKQYAVIMKRGSLDVFVSRDGGDLSVPALVTISTKYGSAVAGTHYLHAEETLVFKADETQKVFKLSVIDNKYYPDEKTFTVRLSNVRLANQNDTETPGSDATSHSLQLVEPTSATVTIVNDSHSGIINFTKDTYDFPETVGTMVLKVTRVGGLDDRVTIPYKTSDEAGVGEIRYNPKEGSVIFESQETEKDIRIVYYVENWFEEDFTFNVELKDPIVETVPQTFGAPAPSTVEYFNNAPIEAGRTRLGEIFRCKIRVTANKDFKNIVDQFTSTPTISFVLSPPPWKDQFRMAISFSTGYGDREGYNHCLSFVDYTFHSLTIFWKLICALIPPANYIGGWACFLASFFFVAILVFLINDIACQFSCIMGIPDAVTAITLVSIGICLPDIFVCKRAAIREEVADIALIGLTSTIPVTMLLGGGISLSIVTLFLAPHWYIIVPPGAILFAARQFYIMIIVVVVIFMFRRPLFVGGELGGNMKLRFIMILLLVVCWITFIITVSLECYGLIDGS